MKRLLVRPRRLPEESDDGFLLRSLEANDYDSSAGFRRIVAKKLDLPESRTPLSVPRFCPICLCGEPYWRKAWQEKLATCCGVHGVQLLDTCPGCASRLSWRRDKLCMCDCGYELQKAPTKPAERTELVFDSIASGTQCQFKGLPEGFSLLESKGLQRLVQGFAVREDAQSTRKTGIRIAGLGNIEVARKAIISAIAPFDKWPESFHKWIDERIACERPDVTIQHCFRASHGHINGWLGACVPTIRDEFERRIAERWHRPIDSRNRGISVAARALGSRIPLTQAARELGVHPGRLCTAAAHHFVVNLQRNRSYGSLSRSQISALREEMEDEIDGKEAAKLLGLSKLRFRDLCHEDWVVQGRIAPAGIVRRYSRRRVHAWLERLFSSVTYATAESPRAMISFDRACRFVLRAEEIGTLLGTVLEGKLPAESIGSDVRGLKALSFAQEDLNAWLDSIRPATGQIALPIAAKELGVKQEVAYYLARRGLLQCERSLRGRRSCMNITRGEMAKFRRTFVSGVELARCRGVSPTSLIALLAKHNVHPAVGPSVDGCRQAFFLRSDMRKLGRRRWPTYR